ncbi:MAG: hypothetical protein MI757_03900 [Pirellulales bacterium]|nr:hypothetical protein [Pirellulales bacterium]
MSEEKFRPYTPENEGPPDFLVTLGLAPPVTVEEVEAAYLAKREAAESDAAADESALDDLKTAYEDAKEYAAFRAGRRDWMAGQVEPYLRQQELAEELEKRGAAVEFKHTQWLERSFGEGFASLVDKIEAITMIGDAFGDKDITFLAFHEDDLQHLRELDLSTSAVTDESLPLLSRLRGLRKLNLSHTETGDETLDLAKKLPLLCELDITGTSVSLWQRMRLKSLRTGLEVAH